MTLTIDKTFNPHKRKLKAITPEGRQRKVDRIMMRMLKDCARSIYDTLEEAANKIVDEHNANPFVRLSTYGVQSLRHPSDKLRQAEKDRVAQITAIIEQRMKVNEV